MTWGTAKVKTIEGGTQVRWRLDLHGPFFETDPGATFDANVRRLMESIAAAGQEGARAMAPEGQHLRPGIVGRTHKLTGAPFKHPEAVVSATYVYPWKGHTSESAGASAMVGGYRAGAQYRGGKAERMYHFFRRTASQMRRASKLINASELLKGLQ